MLNREIGIVDPKFTKPNIQMYQTSDYVNDREYSGNIEYDDDKAVLDMDDLGGRIIRMNE
jgi:hypothetical protein